MDNATVWISIASLAVSTIVAFGLRAYSTGRWTSAQERDTRELGRRVDEFDRRMDRASKLMSDLTSDLNGMEERFRRVFMTREIAEERRQVADQEREYLREEVAQLRGEVKTLTALIQKDMAEIRAEFSHRRRSNHHGAD